MENAVSSCRLCGGILKPRARRCSTCGADLSLIIAPHTSDTAEQSLCDTTISEKLVMLNKKLSVFSIVGFIFIGCGVVAFSFAQRTDSGGLHVLAIFSVLIGIACFAKRQQYYNEKKTLISERVVWAMLADNFELIEYNATETFSDEQFQASQLRWGWGPISGNDLMKARYKGVDFEFSDVRLMGSVGNEDSQTYKWQWMIIDLHRKIPKPLMVSELESKGSFGYFNKRDRQPQIVGKFNVLCESPDIASQALTPEFVNFLFMANAPQHLLFEGKTVHYGRLTGLDFFEPCKNIRDIPAVRERIQMEIDWIKQIIDGFILIEYLFPKDAPDSKADSKSDRETDEQVHN